MGHFEYVIVKKVDQKVQAYITKCQNLMMILGRLEAKAIEHQNSCEEGTSACFEIVTEATENLSGNYHDDKYIPYRNDTFKIVDDINEGDNSMIAAIRERIDKLSEIIEKKREHLYYEALERIWVNIEEK